MAVGDYIYPSGLHSPYRNVSEIIKNADGTTSVRYGGSRTPFIISMLNIDGSQATLAYLNYPSQGDDPNNKKDPEILQERIIGVEMLINPTSLTNNMSKMVSRTQSMVGFIEDHWGEELDTVTFQGSTAAFVTIGIDQAVGGGTENQDLYGIRLNLSSPVKTYYEQNVERQNFYDIVGVPTPEGSTSGVLDDEIGLTTIRRRNTMSYRQFLRMVDIFRANGCIFNTSGFVSSRKYIQIYYGDQSYVGFFESLDVTENAVNPYRFEYTATFKSERTVYSFVDPSVNTPPLQGMD